MTISVGDSWVLPTNYGKVQKCPSGLDLYSPHNLKPSAIKLIVTGLNTWPSEGLQLLLTGYSKQDRRITVLCIKVGTASFQRFWKNHP